MEAASLSQAASRFAAMVADPQVELIAAVSA